MTIHSGQMDNGVATRYKRFELLLVLKIIIVERDKGNLLLRQRKKVEEMGSHKS